MTNSLQDKLLDDIRHTYCRVAVTKHGCGLIAVRNIKRGTVIYLLTKEQSTSVHIPTELVYEAAGTKEVKEMVHDLFEHRKDCVVVDIVGLLGSPTMSLLNHSLDENVRFFYDKEKRIGIRALHNIAIGEELVTNYYRRKYVHFNFLRRQSCRIEK